MNWKSTFHHATFDDIGVCNIFNRKCKDFGDLNYEKYEGGAGNATRGLLCVDTCQTLMPLHNY